MTLILLLISAALALTLNNPHVRSLGLFSAAFIAVTSGVYGGYLQWNLNQNKLLTEEIKTVAAATMTLNLTHNERTFVTPLTAGDAACLLANRTNTTASKVRFTSDAGQREFAINDYKASVHGLTGLKIAQAKYCPNPIRIALDKATFNRMLKVVDSQPVTINIPPTPSPDAAQPASADAAQPPARTNEPTPPPATTEPAAPARAGYATEQQLPAASRPKEHQLLIRKEGKVIASFGVSAQEAACTISKINTPLSDGKMPFTNGVDTAYVSLQNARIEFGSDNRQSATAGECASEAVHLTGNEFTRLIGVTGTPIRSTDVPSEAFTMEFKTELECQQASKNCARTDTGTFITPALPLEEMSNAREVKGVFRINIENQP